MSEVVHAAFCNQPAKQAFIYHVVGQAACPVGFQCILMSQLSEHGT